MKLFVKENAEAKASNIVIMSAERFNLDHTENLSRSLDLAETLENQRIPFTHALGCYKGTTEKSVVIKPRADHYWDDMDMIFVLASEYDQESILVRENGRVYLAYMDGRTEEIGTEIKAVPLHEAKAQDAYTLMGTRCFIVK